MKNVSATLKAIVEENDMLTEVPLIGMNTHIL
jgi:hypothetical protein